MVSVKDAYKKARETATQLAALAQMPEKEERRESIHAFGVNPDMSVVVVRRMIVQGPDAAQKCIDSGALDNKPAVKAAAMKLSNAIPLNDSEKKLLGEEAKHNSQLATALRLQGQNISEYYTQNVDITKTVLEWTIRKSLTDGGGVLSLKVQPDFDNETRSINLGDKFYLRIEGELIFWGVCGEIVYPNEWEVEYTVNDAMWYLRNKLVWIQREPILLSDAFATICQELALPYEHPTLPKEVLVKPKLKPRAETNGTAMSILQAMITETMIIEQKQYAIRMSPDKLELIDLEGRWDPDNNRLVQDGTGFDVGEAMTSFKATQSIQQETYNDVRAFSNISNTLHGYNVQDLPSIGQFGVLRYQEVLNNAIISEVQLDNILSITKYPTNDLDFSIVGIINLMPGDTIRLFQSIYLCSSITYTYNSSGYTMDISCARWQKPQNSNGDTVGNVWSFINEREQEMDKKQQAPAKIVGEA